MSFSEFSQFQILQGLFGLIWVVIAILVGVRILLKALKLKRKDLIGFGLTYICLSSAWWSTVIQFFIYGIFSITLPEPLYLFIANVFIPLGFIPWMYAFSQTIIPFRNKQAIIITSILSFLWEILLISLLVSGNVALVGDVQEMNILDFSYGAIMRYIMIGGIIAFLLTGGYFSVKSIKVGDPEIRWKGIFLLLGWISFAIGAGLDAFIKIHTGITLVLTRVILITSSLEYYLGFFLPNRFKEILIKKD
jgi:hypothetical protein